ncbi:hypothetical protein C6370_20320 [Bacillus atrophaeus]|uniref:SPbeta prophage-derived uncharacterized protein YoqI n=4 Tax=root TaxID=1 RepID=YOQI_BACSU|nr:MULTISPECIES: hypothetical protein [Bacillales]NP_046657.1 hypothetical protein SPBc2p105 [Bacillus phage SPBc2]NP_389944.1 conserved hypothetical protein; phage SPbeta [Bacillus subtilis subsp. subtilis str. 168]O34339.1 RecName: Full=SPbeta prophage-derived uncharacterized protein YoqI [Bacillus subtilis subsp. subtilis str. 168]QMV48852.1 hypothetical protein Goe11_c00990 [Bacillus phage vB_BsuS-Goe11]QMV49206.1 hypothetical protein Goe13_c01050 [Bacillus phage vB_BsuS-Goe13]UIS26544.1 
MIKSIILPEENTKITVGKPINDESNTKVIAIYDYREEPEEAFWVHLSNGNDLFVDNHEVIVEYE